MVIRVARRKTGGLRRGGVLPAFWNAVDGHAGLGLDRYRRCRASRASVAASRLGPCEYRLALRQVLYVAHDTACRAASAVRGCLPRLTPAALPLARDQCLDRRSGRVTCRKTCPGPVSRSPRRSTCRLRASSPPPCQASRPRATPPASRQTRAKRLPVDVPLVGAGHRAPPVAARRQDGCAGVAEALPAPIAASISARRVENASMTGPRNAGDLEAPVRVGFLDAVAQLLQSPCQLRSGKPSPIKHLRGGRASRWPWCAICASSPCTMLAITACVWSWGSRLRETSWRKVADHHLLVLSAWTRSGRLSGSFMRVSDRAWLLEPGKGASSRRHRARRPLQLVAAEHRRPGTPTLGAEKVRSLPGRWREGAVLLKTAAEAAGPSRPARRLRGPRLKTSGSTRPREPQRLGAPAGPGAGVPMVFAVVPSRSSRPFRNK